jgi:hypothetical protein
MTPNSPIGRQIRISRTANEAGLGICMPKALEIKSGSSVWFTKNSEELRRGHHDAGTNVHPGPAKPQPEHYNNIIKNTLSPELLGE